MRRGQDEARRKKKFAMFVRTPMIYSPPSFYLILYTFCLYIFFFFFIIYIISFPYSTCRQNFPTFQETSYVRRSEAILVLGRGVS